MVNIILWIIVAIVIIVGFTYIKFSSTKDQIKLVIVVILVLFLFGTILIVYTSNKLELSSSEGITESIKIYFGFLANGFKNLKTITGKAIDMDWTSSNASFFNKTEIEQKKI